MLKLLIADDEYLVLDSIKMIVSKNVKDVDVVATASTGREAIEYAISLKPDIVFMDIHMPGIDGMEAIRQIKKVNNDTFFVIITAYDYFDYAKEALNMGVFEYLLKPINKKKLIECLNNIKVNIDKKRGNLIREIELKEKMNSIIPSLEAQFIINKSFNIGLSTDIEFYENIFSMNLKYGYAMAVLLEGLNSKRKENSLKLDFVKQNFYDVFNMKLKSLCACLIGNPMADRIIVFIPTNGEEESAITKERSIDIAKRVIEKIKGLSDLKYQIGIGRRYKAESFGKSCNEAYLAASKAQSKAVTYYEDVILSDNIFDTYPFHKESAFSNSMLTANIKEAKEPFLEIYVWLTNVYGEDIDRIKSKLMELLFLIDKNLPYKSKKLDELKKVLILRIIKINNKGELRTQFLVYLSELAKEIQIQRKGDIYGVIPTVLEYLNKNYDHDISLNDVAKSVNLSYNYLSKVFKDEIGKSFIDYLTELRIDKSMKLLANENISIKEICLKNGYNDPNYYSKAFKKITGMTPTEYRTFINGGSGYID
ncbi:response regulator transcription factor [Clostridium sp.]|uniref:response regulator transcription factor n=1 Tax=Clostridium sp. TaxID=1506 RepID=UPI003D6D1F8B